MCSRGESLTTHLGVPTKLIKVIAAAAVIGASLVSPNAALAALGAAEEGTKRTFDAYCGKEENDCKVKFTGERLTMNSNDGIDKGQILNIDLAKSSGAGLVS